MSAITTQYVKHSLILSYETLSSSTRRLWLCATACLMTKHTLLKARQLCSNPQDLCDGFAYNPQTVAANNLGTNGRWVGIEGYWWVFTGQVGLAGKDQCAAFCFSLIAWANKASKLMGGNISAGKPPFARVLSIASRAYGNKMCGQTVFITRAKWLCSIPAIWNYPDCCIAIKKAVSSSTLALNVSLSTTS